MEESSPVSLKSLSAIKPLPDNTLIANAHQKPISKMKIANQKECLSSPEERNIDFEIKEIEKEINRLSSRLESLRLEKAKTNAKVMEKRGRIIAANYLDPPKQSTRSSNEESKIEDSMSLSAKLKTPRRGLSLGPTEIMRGVRRGIRLDPVEIYSATKSKQFREQDITTSSANRRKSCYWKLNDIDDLRVTKEMGKSLSLSSKSRSKTATTSVGSKKPVKKEDAVISSIQLKKLFTKDVEKPTTAKKSIKSGRVVASRYNQVCNGGNSAAKEVRKRSVPENEEDLRRSDKQRVSLTQKSQGGEQSTTETRLKKKWEMKNLRCINECPTDSSPAKMEDGIDEEVEASVCQSLSFAEEEVMEEYPEIRILRHNDDSPRDSGELKRVSQLVGRKTFFNDDEDAMPVFSFEEKADGEEN